MVDIEMGLHVGSKWLLSISAALWGTVVIEFLAMLIIEQVLATGFVITVQTTTTGMQKVFKMFQIFLTMMVWAKMQKIRGVGSVFYQSARASLFTDM